MYKMSELKTIWTAKASDIWPQMHFQSIHKSFKFTKCPLGLQSKSQNQCRQKQPNEAILLPLSQSLHFKANQEQNTEGSQSKKISAAQKPGQ